MLRLVFTLVVCAAFFGPAPTARSAPIHNFNDAVFAAYGYYREALFYLRTGNAQVASFELEEMTVRWKAIVKRFADSPPDVFAADPAWRETILDIDKRAAGGLEAALKNDAKAARTLLIPVRKMLSDLRRRNGIFNFSDYVDNANAAFEKLWKYRHNPPNFESLEQVDELRRTLAITVYWFEMCRDNAPAAIREKPEFKRLIETSLFSFTRIWGAIANKREDILISVLRGLRSSDKMLFLRFG